MSQLIVDLRTNYLARDDFRNVEVTVARRRDKREVQYALHTAGSGDYAAGQRIAEFTDIDLGRDYVVFTKLLDDHGRAVDAKVILLESPHGDFSMTVLITRP